MRSVRPLLSASPNLHRAEDRPVDAHDRDGAALAHGVDRPVQRDRGAALQLELGGVTVLQEVPSASAPPASMTTSGPRWSVIFFMARRRFVVLGEVARLGVRERSAPSPTGLEVVDDDDAAGAHQPRGLRGVEPDRPGPEHAADVALGDVAELRPEVAGRAGRR
jgi:hypothetical protein